VAREEIPTLVKYADVSPYLEGSTHSLEAAARQVPENLPGENWCRLVAFDPQGEERVLAAALYRFGGMDYPCALDTVRLADASERQRLAGMVLGGLGKFDIPLRELEHTAFTFDLVVDQGGYFEIKRHRMMTQTPQPLTAHLGYAIPRRMEAAGMAPAYCEAMEAARRAYDALAEVDPHLAAYVVPNGYNRRVLLTMNLRSAFHFCRLRSASNAHFAVRRAARCMAEQIRQVYPTLAAFIDLSTDETWQGIENQYFSQV